MGEHATAKCNVFKIIDEPSMVRKKNKNNDCNNQSLINIPRKTLNPKPIDVNHVATKSHVDFLSGNDRKKTRFISSIQRSV